MMRQIQKMDFFWSGKRVLETDILTTLFQLSHKKLECTAPLYLASFFILIRHSQCTLQVNYLQKVPFFNFIKEFDKTVLLRQIIK